MRRRLTFPFVLPRGVQRVWVEVTGGDDRWRWAFYSSAKRLRRLVASLDGRERTHDP